MIKLRVSDNLNQTCIDCNHFYYHKWEVSQAVDYDGNPQDRHEPMCDKLDFSFWDEAPPISADKGTCDCWVVIDER